MRDVIQKLQAAIDATKLAEAWPGDPGLHAEAIMCLAEASEKGGPALKAAHKRAHTQMPERLSFARVIDLREPLFLTTRAVGELMVARVEASPWWPKLLWRVAWVPDRANGGERGAVIAWFANVAHVRGRGMEPRPIGGGLYSLTPFASEEEIPFRLQPMFVDLMMHADRCVFNGVTAFHLSPVGVGSIAYARRAAHSTGEAKWRECSIDGLHVTWEEILAAGGPVPR